MLSELETQLADLRRRIAADPALAGLEILPHLRPSVRLTVERVDLVDLGLGETRIGGVPDVPPGFEWPRWEPQQARNRSQHPCRPMPLAFIAQFNLASLPRIDAALPDRGWLYFFYDRYCEPWGFHPDDRGGCRVLFADGEGGGLERAEFPHDADTDHVAAPCRIVSRLELTLPSLLEELGYDHPSFESYCKLSEGLTGSFGAVHHRFFGHPQVIQNPMERECQLASNGINAGAPHFQAEAIKVLEPGIAEWRLLLQIDSDDEGPGWMWGDVGRIYFWIRQQDLVARQFENVWLVLQCS